MHRAMMSLFAALLLAGCSGKQGIEGSSCNASGDCEGSLHCMDRVCRSEPALSASPASEPSKTSEPSPATKDGEAPPSEPDVEAMRAELEALRGEVLTLKEGSGDVSAAECRAFGEKIVELTVQGQEGAAADMARQMITAMRPELEKECLTKGTKKEIDCALMARSLEDLERCDEGAGAERAAGSGDQPSRASCEAFADKVVELTVQGQEGEAAKMAREMITAMRPEMIKECRSKGTKSEINCALKAGSLEDLERCDGA